MKEDILNEVTESVIQRKYNIMHNARVMKDNVFNEHENSYSGKEGQ